MGADQSYPNRANQPRVSYQGPPINSPNTWPTNNSAGPVYPSPVAAHYNGYHSQQPITSSHQYPCYSQQQNQNYPVNTMTYPTQQPSTNVHNVKHHQHIYSGSGTMAAPPVDDNFLKKVFQQVDKDRSNAINAVELQSCLSNGTWEPFNGETVRLMITLFDRSLKGQLNYDEFKQLWKYIEDWRQCFQSFDKDKSGYINKDEIKQALTTFGYQLSDKFYDLILQKFVKSGQGRIYFDDFIQICVSLQTITAAFRHHDTDSDGVITIKYEDFLSLVFSMR